MLFNQVRVTRGGGAVAPTIMFQTRLDIRIVLNAHQGLPERKVLPPTVPESPAFALKKRVHREAEVEKVRTLLQQDRCRSPPFLP